MYILSMQEEFWDISHCVLKTTERPSSMKLMAPFLSRVFMYRNRKNFFQVNDPSSANIQMVRF